MKRKYFNPHLSESLFIRPYQLYGENKQILQNLDYFKKSNIYFVTTMDTVRVIPSSVKITWRKYLKFTLCRSDGKRKKVKIPISPLLIDCGEAKMFRKVFKTESILQKNLRKVKTHVEYERLNARSNQLPKIGLSLEKDNQLGDQISLGVFTPDGQKSDFEFTLHSILSKFEIDFSGSPEIRYIGQTKELKKRIYKHEKVQQALAESRDNKDVYIYFFQFREQRITHERYQGVSIIGRDDVTEIKKKSKIDLVEMCLINYFKPRPLNSDFVNADIPSNTKVRKNLKNNGYTDISLEIDHDGNYWKFWTETIDAAYRHEIQIQIQLQG